jgi:D-alanyl-lipoteichoic acid acyltransferase DltB (MBOAT superfamily)
MSEKTEQKTLVKWFHYQYRPTKIIAIPNAQKHLRKSKNIFAIIKSMIAEGFVKGASDLFIAKASSGYHGMWLEMKDVAKSYKHVDDDQRQFIKDMLDAGYYATWASGFEQAQEKITDYMNGHA